MSAFCMKGREECDGGCCMLCAPAKVVGTCEVCGNEIHAGEDHYDFDGELVCDDHLREWAKKYLVRG